MSNSGQAGYALTPMRRKLVIGVLVVGVVVVAWLVAGPKAAAPTQVPRGADPSADGSAGNPAPGAEPAEGSPGESAFAISAGTDGTRAETPEAKQQAEAAKRVVELQDLGMESDSVSLETILAELDNGNASIRQAAVEAAVQFGSQDAIPKLRQAAARTDDPKEKSALLEAVEFLSLPTLGEALAREDPAVPEATSGAHPGQ